MNTKLVAGIRVTFAGSGDAFGSGGRFQACLHLTRASGPPTLLDCGATSLVALKRLGLDPLELSAVFVSHLHGDHFGGLPFLILDAQFRRRTEPLVLAGPPGLGDRLTRAMEVLYPGSSTVQRRFEVRVVELTPGETAEVAGIDHLDHRTLAAHRAELNCQRIMLTHLSGDMLGHLDEAEFEAAHDGLTLDLAQPERSH